jgi:DNA repair exonuclease SbcCD ATPase subunit
VDGQPTSNGSGKSAVTLALLQCMYNRNPKVNMMESCSNTVTKKPYSIQLYFTANENDYLITNDRSTMSIKVYNLTTDILMSSRIKESLIVIEDIIGMSYEEFITLSLITQDTISNIFSTDTNLVLRYFDLTMIDTYLARAKKQRQIINSSIKLTKLRLTDITKMVGVVNVSDINKDLDRLNNELVTLNATHPYVVSKDKLNENNNELKYKVQSLEVAVRSLEGNLSISNLGVCPTCNQDVSDIDTSSLLIQLATSKSELELTKANMDGIESKLAELSKDYHSSVGKITDNIRLLESKLVTQQHISEVSTSDIDELQLELVKLEKELQVVKSLINLMDSGKVTTAYLHSFMMSLNVNISDITHEVGSTFNILASISKGRIQFTITDDDISKDIDMLSGGEHTIVALIVLLGVYRTLNEQLNVSLPLLVIDEALNRIDTLNIKVVSDLINLLKVDKTVIVIQHHNELPSSAFDGSIEVNKLNGVTT